MNQLREVCLVALTLATSVTPCVAVQAPVTAWESSSFAGTWEGTTNGLPGVKLKILEVAGNFMGTATFYFQKRDDTASPWRVAGETSVPLLAPHLEGKTLKFEVQHHRCHTCSDFGPNVKFRMVLVDPSEARLWNQSEAKLSDPGLKLNRRTERSADTTPALQKGISVEMPVTRNAAPVPDADQEDAMVVVVARDGSIYLRVDPVNHAALAARLKATRSNNADKKLYIKADARTLYANVVTVLDAARAADVESLTLLTSQPGPTQPGGLAPPKGLDVRVGPRSHYGPDVAVVYALRSGQQVPKLTISNQPIPWASLQTMLADLLRHQVRKVVLVNAEETLPFSDVVNMIDRCRSIEAEVVLVRPGT